MDEIYLIIQKIGDYETIFEDEAYRIWEKANGKAIELEKYI